MPAPTPKLKHKHFTIFLTGLLLLAGPVFSQDKKNEIPTEESCKDVNSAQVFELRSQIEREGELNKYRTERKTDIEALKQLLYKTCHEEKYGRPTPVKEDVQVEFESAEGLGNVPPELKEMMKMIPKERQKELMDKLMSGDNKGFQESFKKVMIESAKNGEIENLAKRNVKMMKSVMSHDDMVTKYVEVMNNLGQGFVKFDSKSKIPNYAARISRDDDAMPKLASMFKKENRTRIYIFLGLTLLTIILNAYLKKKQREQYPTVGERFGHTVKRILGFVLVRVGLLVGFYGKFLAPAFYIFLEVFFGIKIKGA